MKRFLAVVMFLVVSVSVAYGGWFPITAWGIKYNDVACTTWVEEVSDSFLGNSTKIGWPWSGTSTIEALLNKGADCGVDFIIQGLRTSGMDLRSMARAQFSSYQSEEHNSSSITSWPPAAGYFDEDSCIGDTVTDPLASNDTAWKVLVASDTAGFMQGGLIQHHGHRQRYLCQPYLDDSLRYEARFYLRIPDTSGSDSLPVCRLEVRRNTTILDSHTIYRTSFSDTNAYETFSLWFTKDTSMATSRDRDGRALDNSPMDYRIYWYDNYNLYADKVEVRDTVFYNLEATYYDTTIANIVDKWDDYPALKYYFLFDEPHLNQLNAFQLVKQAMPFGAEPPITCVSHQYGEYGFYNKFIKDCYGNDPTALLVDKYELRPEDSTPATIQAKFNTLCAWMDTVRGIADTTGTPDPYRNVWYVCQAHMWIKENGDTVLRDPLPREIWALAGLGLAHGAKGILYFTYKSRYDITGFMYLHGLVDDSSGTWIKNSKWYAARDVNAVLQVIDTFLLDFEFQNAFRGNNLQDYIDYSSLDSLSEFGLFEDSDNLKYFLIVNRTNPYPDTTTDSSLVTLGMDGSLYSGWYYIRDCYSGEPLKWDSTSGGEAPTTVYFKFYLKDCHFRLFQLVPFTCNVKTNNDSTYTDYPFVKVYFDTTTSLSFGANDTIYMTVWDNEGDTIKNVIYDSTLIWQFDSPGNRIITTSFKIVSDNYIQGDSGYLTPTYCDTIYLDTIPPSSNSLEVEDVDTLPGFVNSDSVNLEIESTDAGGIPVRKMRFSNYGFVNLIQNPDFDTTTFWVCVDSASIDSGYGEIDGDFGGTIYQDIDDTLFVEDKVYRLYAYVVTDSFVSDSGRIRVSYMYVDTTDGDTTYSTLKTMDISSGDNALTGYNCVTDTFTYNPEPSPFSHDTTLGCRLEVHQNNNGDGRLIVDKFLLEREYTESCWHNYDSTYADWALTSGNGQKIVSGEFRDAAGNITTPVSDTVILDTIVPVDTITSPRPMQIISGTINIRGWAHDSAAAEQHFYYYKLEYKSTGIGSDWHDCDSVYYYDQKYPDPNQPSGSRDSSVVLGQWNTTSVENGIYNLRLTVVDSASNSAATTIIVSVSNGGDRGFGEFSAGKEPKGISGASHFYVTDLVEGDLRKYNHKGDSIGYISLIKDSLGISKPCAAVIDSGGIWIGDKHSNTVAYYDYTGNLLLKFGGFGADEGKFKHPSGIACFNDKVYVTDKLNHRVQVFNRDSTFLFSFGTKGDSAGQFNEPMGIAADRCGRLYVTDRLNNRVEVFDSSGEYIEEIGEGIDLQHPCGILVDSFGYIFVVDEVNGKVLELDPYGDPICEFGEKGEGFGKFLFPQDIAISGDGEKLYVTDKAQKKVVMFEAYFKDSGGGPMSAGEGETPIINCLKSCYPVPFSSGVTISYSIARKGKVSVKVYDVTGRVVKRLVTGVQDRGWYTIHWEGDYEKRGSVSSGVYFIRLETGDFISTKKVLLVK